MVAGLKIGTVALIAAIAVVSAHAQDEREKSLVDLANQERADAGLKPLAWDPALAAAARAHAGRMAAEGPIAHRYSGEPDLPQRAAQAGARFSLIEENIAVADTAFHVHQGWMKSQGHHDNLLNPNIDRIGVALVPARGVLYAVADYAQGVAPLSAPGVEASVAGVLQSRGLQLKSDGAAAARQYCSASGDAAPEGTYARFLMRWQSADIARLPPPLEQRIASGVYHQAAVGACPPQGDNGAPSFSAYRVAVLLY